MRRFIFFLVALSCLAACNMPAAANPTPEVAPVLSTAQPASTLIVPLAATSTLAIPSPTQQVADVPTLTALPLPQTVASNIIQFQAGGTWKDTQDSIPSGKSKTYILNAMQGQIMSVSVFAQGDAWGYFPLQIQGRNGTVLCPVAPNTECSFWRGTLPLSQDYFITVKSAGDQTNFTLRVAINPPGKSEQLFAYNTSQVSLAYSDQFAPAGALSMLNNKTNPQLTLHLIDTSFYVNTNLGEAYFVLGSSSDPQIVAACAQPNQNGIPETPGGNVAVNGYDFAYATLSDAGAGNYYEQHIYRVVNNGSCYEAIYFIHSANIGNFPPGVVKEFDHQSLMNKFNAILSTIQLK